MLRRLFSTSRVVRNRNYFELFPSSFKRDSKNLFKVDLKNLRKEYRALQAIHHPDKTHSLEEKEQEENFSNLLNQAYNQLKSPLTRSQYLLGLKGVDLSRDDNIIEEGILMEILSINEQLESIESEAELEKLQEENNTKINKIHQQLDECFEKNDLEKALHLTVNLKYYENIKKSIKNWEAGKPISITH